MATGLQPIPLNKIELFAAQYLTHYFTKPVAKPHREIYRALQDTSIQFLNIEAMRGLGKTTVGSVVFALYNICEGNDDEFQVISRSGGTTGTSTKIMAKVKRELEENELLIHDYGIKKGSSWGEDRIRVKRADGHSIDFYSLGKRSSIRGARGTVLIDDPQNRDDCQSETVITRDVEWFMTDVLPVILEDQRLIFIGTPISPLSLSAKLKKIDKFVSLSFPAEEPIHSGKSVWPEQYSDEFLADRKAIMGLDFYAAEYLCKPLVSGSPVFKEDWFKYYDPETVNFEKLKTQGLYVVTGMDTAESKRNQADYTAIITLGAPIYEKKPNIYVLDVKRERWTAKEGAEQLLLTFSEFQQNKSRVESRVKDGDATIEEIREKERITHTYVNLYPITPSTDKVARAMTVQSLFQEGRVFFNPKDPKQQGLMDELIMFTGEQTYHDDQVDAICMALSDIKEREKTDPNTQIKSAVGDNW